MEYGNVKGEVCNREGCNGIIDEYPKEGSCSCHVNPPCSYCTTDTSYCPVCGWEHEDEVIKIDPEIAKKNMEYYEKERQEWNKNRELFYAKYHGKHPIEKLEMRTEGHTHFSQKVIGVFPPGTETRKTIEEKAKGTFGGRFDYFGDYSFTYIAYTD